MSLTVDVVTTDDGFAALQEPWRLLAAASPDASVFHTWDWLFTWWQHFGRSSDSSLHIVTVHDEAGLVAVAPMAERRLGSGPLRVPVLLQISQDAGDYGGMVVARRHHEVAAVVVEHFGEVVRAGTRPVELRRVADDSPTFLALVQLLPASPLGVDARVVDVSLHADLQDPNFDLARRRRKHRVRQRLARLQEERRTELRLCTGDGIEDGLGEFVRLHERRWEAASETQRGLLSDPRRREFLLDACRALDRNGHLRLLTLWADGEMIAGDLDFALGHRLFLFKTAFHPGFSRYAPGHLLVSEAFERSIDEGSTSSTSSEATTRTSGPGPTAPDGWSPCSSPEAAGPARSLGCEPVLPRHSPDAPLSESPSPRSSGMRVVRADGPAGEQDDRRRRREPRPVAATSTTQCGSTWCGSESDRATCGRSAKRPSCSWRTAGAVGGRLPVLVGAATGLWVAWPTGCAGHVALSQASTARTRRLSSGAGGRSSFLKMLFVCLPTAFSDTTIRSAVDT